MLVAAFTDSSGRTYYCNKNYSLVTIVVQRHRCANPYLIMLLPVYLTPVPHFHNLSRVQNPSESGHSYDRNFRKSNSLYDHYRDERISRVINSITKKSLGV